MRFSSAALGLLFGAACTPVRVKQAPPAMRAAVKVPEPALKRFVAPARPAEPSRVAQGTCHGISFVGVAFDSRVSRLVVADQVRGPGSEYADAAAAGQARGGFAAVNAGFFTPSGQPLGWVVSHGKRAGAWNSTTSLGSGVWYDDGSGHSAIARREALGKAAASGMRELVQAGPMLVENGHPVAGLDATKPAFRTLLAWDGGTRWWIGHASSCTLAELGSMLTGCKPAGWPVKSALNLDGGRSSDLWISTAIPGGPVTRRTPWNRPVRNFLILKHP